MYHLENALGQFPQKKENTFARLQGLVQEKQQVLKLGETQQTRLKEELSVIKDTGTAGVFLFFYDTMSALKEYGVVAHGNIHCSYLCYILGITKVNPLDYSLPFERYFNRQRKCLPIIAFATPKGKKGIVIRYLKEQYGVDKVARLCDQDNEYVLSKESVLHFSDIQQTLLQANEDEYCVWHEDISGLSGRDASVLQLYTFTLQEAEIGVCRFFAEQEVYRTATEFFKEHGISGDTGYRGIEEVEKIFSSTDGKYVFQEQFHELCIRLLGMDGERADEMRKDLAKRKKSAMEDMREQLVRRFGIAGETLFAYLHKRHAYAVCKAYVIGLLFLRF